MIKWRATGKVVRANGERTVFYRGDGTDYRIESRTRWIQNNKNNDRRSYFIEVQPDGSERRVINERRASWGI